MALGFATLAVLTALCAVAGLAVGSRLFRTSRSEAALAAAMVFVAIPYAAVHVTGWLGVLDAGSIGAAAAVMSSVAIGASSLRYPGGARAFRREATDLLLLPVAALRECWQQKSFAFVGVLWVFVIAAWTAWLAWLAPSSSWDGLWYHEPMVGWAIQNRGFSEVELPHDFLWVNGYPRLSENLMLWVSVFADRRLIDALPSFFVPLVALSFFALARRFCAWRVGVLGLGSVLVFVPAVVLQLRSTYNDVPVLVMFLASLVFVLSPRLRPADVWIAGVCIGLLAASKSTGLWYGGMIALVALARIVGVVAHRRSGWLLLHMTGALAVLLALAAPTYVRNWLEHDNPMYPLHLEALGIEWEGPHQLQDQQLSFEANLDELFGPPTPGQDYHDTRKHTYGYALPFVALPLGLVALLLLLRATVMAVVRREWGQLGGCAALWVIVATAAATALSSPAFHWGRFQLPVPAALLVLVAWLLGSRRRAVFGQGVVGAMIAMNLVSLYWAEPKWDVTVKDAMALMRQSAAERVGANPTICTWPAVSAYARETEIGPGDVVAFADRVAFVGNLWNERFENEVHWVPYRSRDDFLARLDALQAEWVVVRTETPQARTLELAPGWQRLFEGASRNDVYGRADRAP